MPDKPTWKEIDARKDRSGSGRRSERPESGRNSHMRVSKADVDKLFSSEKLAQMVRKSEEEKSIQSSSDKSLAAMVKACLRIEDPGDFLKQARQILEENESLPSDMEFLERALEINSLPLVIRLLKRIAENLDSGKKPYMPRVLRIRCQTIKMKFQDPKVEDLCEQVLDKL